MSAYGRFGVIVGVLLILGLLVAASVHGGPSGTIIYVDCDAAGGNDGSSWTDAYSSLGDALGAAAAGDEIWVAEGVYYPASDATARSASFELRDELGLYGGFSGTEAERDQRDWEANPTVLSGDLDRNDATDDGGIVTDTVNITGSNAYHVVTGEGVTETAALAGFIITAGSADGAEWPQDTGGGMYNVESSPQLVNVAFIGNYAYVRGGGMYNSDSTPTLTNVTFSANRAQYGAGMRNTNSNPTLTSVAFSSNQATGSGGGMYNHLSSPSLTDVTFTGNEANYGGGIYNWTSTAALTNVTFSGNQATTSGGGIYNHLGSPNLTDVTFTGNEANYGGGIYNWTSTPTLTTTFFIDNQASEIGGGMYNYLSSATLSEVTFTGNQAEMYGGGMRNGGSSPTLTEVTFAENQAQRGGGMYNEDESSATLTAATFTENEATEAGGGMYNSNSSPMLTHVTFAENQGEWGGGMSNYMSSPNLAGVTFSRNHSQYGGGMRNSGSSPKLINVTFSENDARQGGGMYNAEDSSPTLTNITVSGNQATSGAGMSNWSSSPTLTNVIISGNRADTKGGGMYNADSSPKLTNVTLSGNRAEEGGGMYNRLDSSPSIVNSILWGNSPDNIANTDRTNTTVAYSDVGLVTGVYAGTGNINSDPKFAEPVSASQAPTTAGDYRVREGSPAVDAGTNDVIAVDTDMDGYPRMLDGDGDGSPVVDMGAYEFTPVTLAINYACGKPGSFFTLVGAGFPPDGVARVIVNGSTLTDTLPVKASGDLSFVLDTSAAEAGRYLVKAKTKPSASAAFTLDPSAPLRSHDDSGPILAVPGGIALTRSVYLPFIQR